MRSLRVALILLFAVGAAAQDKAPSLPDGTTLAVQLAQHVDASKARTGDVVRAKLLTPILLHGQIAIPKDAAIVGLVLDAAPLEPMRGSRLVIRFEEARWRNETMALRAYIVRQLAWKSTVYTPEDRSMCPPIYRFLGGQQSSTTSGTSGQQTTPPQNPAPGANAPPLAPPPRPAESPLDRCDPLTGGRNSGSRRRAQEKVTFTSPPLEAMEIRRLATPAGATELVSSTKIIVLKKGTMLELRNALP